MRINPITLILIFAFAYPILKGFMFKFSSHNLKSDIREAGGNISFILSLIFGVYFSKKIFIEHNSIIYTKLSELIPVNILDYIEDNTVIFYVVVVPIMIFCFYKVISLIIEGINHLTLYPLVNVLEKVIETKGSMFKRVSGAFFQLPRAVGYILFITLVFNILAIFNVPGKYNKYLEDSKAYNYLCKEVVIPVTNSSIARELPNILDNSFKVVIKDADTQNTGLTNLQNAGSKRVVVYYNGVTLDEGVKSNSKIDTFAKEIGSKGTTSKEKARLLYNWVGSNINYDQDKAEKVLNNDFDIKSGAIPTFQTKKGICFDYACLYAAMARANGLKVRIVTGEGFNGVSWVSHAWNQVYIPEEKKWINLDPTFFKGGNYFNSKRFDMDHRNEKIAGEW
ncbi:transglutaminase domain-containing protein [Clostridium sp. YIM B02515]|uniref:Transglutaminase domain-containing protein n=1 Tax=Clostridium rhizosphaerae TaxID=2803861 RepID=A0ABS1TJW4_9CLOT|nr:transglutaminase domain-containing protein [Clostridium rhizosphaerae]MBL4938258.1 transglutaminase domain-containing protein [Clostridium rhizosphaerae]